jgi:hypothetical protein
MEVATYILVVLGILGAIDIAVYHGVAHGIRYHPDARAELVVHSLRGPTYCALFALIPNFALQGAWFWLLMGLFAFDLGISVVDFVLEGSSRRFFGGLPTGEYLLHILMAMLFGAFATAVVFGAGAWATMPTRFAYQPARVPLLLRLVMGVMAALVLGSGVQDALAAVRLSSTDADFAGPPRR